MSLAAIRFSHHSTDQRLERQWVYETIFPRTVAGIKEGLQECLNLLHHADITLPLSSRETERLKGVTTRQGADIIKGVSDACDVDNSFDWMQDLMIKTKHGTHRLLLSKDKVIHLDQILDCTHLIEFSVNALEHELYPDTAKRVIDDVLYNLKSAHSSLLQCTFAQTFPTKVVDPHVRNFSGDLLCMANRMEAIRTGTARTHLD